MSRITVVSGDGHGGPTFEKYRSYIEPAYRERLDDLAQEEHSVKTGLSVLRQTLNADGIQSAVDDRGVLEAGEYLGLYENVQRRLAQMDAEGIAGDMVLAGSEYALPFFHEINGPYPADVRAAGVRAYHRWLADFVGESGGRLFAHGYSLPSTETAPMLEELRFIAETPGFVSVELPGYVVDSDLPSLMSDFYEPFWSACAEYGLVVNMHAGYGHAQGHVLGMLSMAAQMADMIADGTLSADMMSMGGQDGVQSEFETALLLGMEARQALWQIMLAGVFDRHPDLKVALVELRADWIPATLEHLDAAFAGGAPHLKLKPSEYFARNCAVTPSAPRPTEVQMRHDIGVDRFMFGADMPHPEGTWPNTRSWLAHTFVGVPEEELRKILGENAIRFYNLDRGPLDAAAARIGPTPDEIASGMDLDERVLTHFDRRSGYLKPVAEFDAKKVDDLLTEDFARARVASG